MKFVAVIPARLASTRLPRKPLREIAGKTMIARVYEAVAASKLVSETIVATDAREVVEHCEKLGIPARMTSVGAPQRNRPRTRDCRLDGGGYLHQRPGR